MNKVRTSIYMELVARKLFGINTVPSEEQIRMIARLAKAVDKLCVEKDQEINSLQDRIKQLEEQLEWKPIETAPKDGSYILAYCPNDYHKKQIICFDCDEWLGLDDMNGCKATPTHWLPIPEYKEK